MSVAFPLILTTTAMTQTHTEPSSGSVGVHVGYFLPLGDWNKHRFAPNIDQFGGNIGFGGDLEIRLSDRWGLAITGGYSKLDVSEWEDFARAAGDDVTASASVGHIGLLLRPYLGTSRPDIIKIELGASLVFTKGKETFGRFSYEYDFLKSTVVGILLGIEYDRFLSENIALAARISSMIVPSGIEYADGVDQSLIIMPLTIGMRFHF